jgi:hypothetical protein
MPLAASITMTAESTAVSVLEGHDRGDHRNAALAFDRHPVRAGGAPVALGLDLPGELDRPAEQQELLRQRGLARVRMGDDGKGPAPLDLGCKPSRGALGGANGNVHGERDVAVPVAPIKAGSPAVPRVVTEASQAGT